MQEEIARLQKVLDELLPRDVERNVLEAGCGSAGYLHFGNRVHLIGIDISEKQLQRNTMLQKKIRGDIQAYDFGAKKFDVTICWDVLEHLPYPRRALQNLADSVKPGGLLVLAFPNVFSAKGLITKFTPLPLHVWAYKRVFGFKNAGKDDHGPFKTYLRLAISPGAIGRFAESRGFAVEYIRIYESSEQKRIRGGSRLLNASLAVADAVFKIVTLGRVSAYRTDCMFVLRRGTPLTTLD